MTGCLCDAACQRDELLALSVYDSLRDSAGYGCGGRLRLWGASEGECFGKLCSLDDAKSSSEASSGSVREFYDDAGGDRGSWYGGVYVPDDVEAVSSVA